MARRPEQQSRGTGASRALNIGGKIRRLRRDAGMSQTDLAGQLDVSASYLNLIEHNKRKLTAALLLKIAGIFGLDLADLADDDETQLFADIMDVLGDDLFEELDLTNSDAKALVETTPNVARALLQLHDAWRKSQTDARSLAARALDAEAEPVLLSAVAPAEAISDFIQDHNNYFDDLELEADRVGREIGIIETQSRDALVDYLRTAHDVNVDLMQSREDFPFQRQFDPERRVLRLSERLSPASRRFQIAHQIGLLSAASVIDMLLAEARLRDDDTRRLGRVALANYFAAALLMPYERFFQSVQDARYDVELLGHRFSAEFEQICHRLTSLNRPGMSGIPLHMLRVDVAGNISKRFSLSGLPIPRHGEACARWNVYSAFMTPGTLQAQISELPDGMRYFCIARTVRKGAAGYGHEPRFLSIGLGCEDRYASQMVYADGIVTGAEAKPAPIGINCRICERMDCPQRAHPPVHVRVQIDENTRGASPYTPGSNSRDNRGERLPTR